MNLLVKIILILVIWSSSIVPVHSQEESNTNDKPSAFITDDLFVYIHTGPGTNYRIIGSINAGDVISLMSEPQNEFTEITDTKGRTGWIQSKYVSTAPSLRTAVADLNGQVATLTQANTQLELTVAEQRQQVSEFDAETKGLKNQITKLTSQLAEQEKLLSNQDMELKKEWFFTGAIVLGIGLIIGFVLPKLGGGRRRSRMDSWN